MPSIEERLTSKIDRDGPGGCWLWTGCLDSHGYGLMWDNRRRNNSRAHRLAYECWVGPIEDDQQLHHRCRVRACCNPAHLEPMDPAEHNGMHHRKTECAQGHPFDGFARGQQTCSVCQAAFQAKYRSANRDAINARRRERRKAQSAG